VNSYMTMAPDLEPFPALSMDPLGLGLQDPSPPPQMAYNAGAGGLSVDQQHRLQQQRQQQQQQQFTPQGSVSPFGHSPNVPQQGFY
jgi:hypothetical protein